MKTYVILHRTIIEKIPRSENLQRKKRGDDLLSAWEKDNIHKKNSAQCCPIIESTVRFYQIAFVHLYFIVSVVYAVTLVFECPVREGFLDNWARCRSHS